MGQGKFLRLTVREHPPDLALEIAPLPLTPKIIHHEKTTTQQIPTKRGDFFVAELEIARLDEVDERIIEQLLVGYFQDLALRIDFERCHFLQTIGEVKLRVGIIRLPIARTAPAAGTTIRTVANSDKGEDILGKSLVDFPQRDPRAFRIVRIRRAHLEAAKTDQHTNDNHPTF